MTRPGWGRQGASEGDIIEGTYRGGVDRGKAGGHGVFTVEEVVYAGYRFEGGWEDNVMRCGELTMEHGTRYVGAFANHGCCFRGRGELWLKGGVRLFDGEWGEHYWSGWRGFARRSRYLATR